MCLYKYYQLRKYQGSNNLRKKTVYEQIQCYNKIEPELVEANNLKNKIQKTNLPIFDDDKKLAGNWILNYFRFHIVESANSERPGLQLVYGLQSLNF